MRFLYSHRTRSGDGQSVHIRELTEALKALGHDVVMAGPGGGGAKQLHARGAGMRSRLPAFAYECAEYGYSFPAYRRLRAHARQARPDIVYERYNLYYHAGVWLTRRAGLPFMLEVNAPLVEERAEHGTLFWKSCATRSERQIWRAADAALAVSGVMADRLREAGIAAEKVHVVYNGAGPAFLTDRDPSDIRKRYGLEGKIVLGFAGFMRDWHGLDRVLDFFAARQRDDLHLLLVGDGPARPGLEGRAQELGLSARISFAGVVQREALLDHVAAFDIALQPAATAYAAPLKLFEYMALGKAIIAPDQPNIREILTDEEGAALFDPASPEGFDKALVALIDNAALRARLGAAARADLIRRDLTWAGAARRVEAIAEKLLETHS